MKYLGGITDVSATWLSATAIRVDFTTVHSTFHHQLYYGRRKVAETSSASQRSMTSQIDGGPWQNHLTVLAVDGADIGVDHGGSLPYRPYNVARLSFDATGFPSDTQTIEIYSGDEPGGAVNTTTPIMVVPYQGAKVYTLYTPPLNGSGTWNIEIVGRDNRDGGGNLGTAATATVTVDAYPPDFEEQFTVTASSGSATITVTLPSDG